MGKQVHKKSYGKAKADYEISSRVTELDEDIILVKLKLKESKSFEATLAFKKLLDKLQHERRITK